MNIGIIVYSETGNTYSVAEEIEKRLSAGGHRTKIERIMAKKGENSKAKELDGDHLPDLEDYEAILFGAQVQAFSLSEVMKRYLNNIPSLEGKKVACFITKGLPFDWTGGTRAVGQMERICKSKGARVLGTGIVKWMSTGREKQIAGLAEEMSALFNSEQRERG